MALKNIRNTASLRWLLLLAFVLNTTPAVSAQVGQRERRATTPVVTAPAPQPTPRPTAAPVTPAPQTAPTPTPPPAVVAALPARPTPRTVEELRARIREVLDDPRLAPSMFGVKVASLETGRVLFEEDAGKLLMPASNMKLYTIAAALDRLGPDFRFVTSVYAATRPDAQGRVRGDLIVYGRGDPTFSTRFNGGDYFKAIDELAARVAAAGVKEIEGDLVGDESYFNGPPLGTGWEWDDLQWYYGAPISALTVNDNAMDLFVKPGAGAGAPGIVTTGPAFSGFPSVLKAEPAPQLVSSGFFNSLVIINSTKTVPRGAKRDLVIHRPLGQSLINVTGSVPADDPGYSGSVAVPDPAKLFVLMLRASLERQGVKIKGRDTKAAIAPSTSARTGSGGGELLSTAISIQPQTPLNVSALVEIAKRESPPFSEIAAQTSKPSQNLYTELILRTLGKQFPKTDADPKQTTVEAGLEVVRTFLREAGVNTERLSLVDGSGLARSNLITAEATIQLLTYMSRHRHAQVFRDAQPLAGVEGTLRGRMKNTPAAGNVRAKTGTINNVAALSGYVTSAAGERLVFSLIINHYPEDSDERRIFLDQIAVLLASFAGRS